MASPVIKIEQLSKKFMISHEAPERYKSLRDVIANKGRQLFKPDREKKKSTEEEFYALRDVSFEVNAGDRVGIIGRNGAGKSTLLKVLSRITEPTHGRITIRGRVASLLEVGTGFHPELTGRENVFLNGAILGMARSEIRRKFDEIVAFAEVEKFLDTPVKRYSSGMYVRLAFAVAAHLEPEILVVDEVLAVGDAQFQKKCLGKMEDVSKNEGRTILFVSHNMGVIAQLCRSAVVMQKGQVSFAGTVSQAVERYIQQNNNDALEYVASESSAKKNIFIRNASVVNRKGESVENILVEENVYIKLRVGINQYNPAAKISITLQNMVGDFLSTFVEDVGDYYKDNRQTEFEVIIKLAAGIIAPNSYALRFAIFIPHGAVHDLVEMACPFRIVDSGSKMALFEGANYGSFILDHEIIN